MQATVIAGLLQPVSGMFELIAMPKNWLYHVFKSKL